MQSVLGVILLLALGAFVIFQIVGFVKDLKKRKEDKRMAAEKIAEAESKEVETFEQTENQ